MSYTSGNLTVDFQSEAIYVTSPKTALTCQEIVDVCRAAEASDEGIAYGQILDAEGKGDLGGGNSTGILVTLLGNWKIEFWSGAGQVTVSGGNIAGGLGKFNFTANTQIVLEQPLGAVISETGQSGLTPEEAAAFTQMALRMAELWKLAGLDAANPMTVTPTSRTVDDISLAISGDGQTSSTVTRQ